MGQPHFSSVVLNGLHFKEERVFSLVCAMQYQEKQRSYGSMCLKDALHSYVYLTTKMDLSRFSNGILSYTLRREILGSSFLLT